MSKSIQEIQLEAFCNWCLNPLVMSGSEFSEANFIDTGKTFDGTTPATAVYCTDCLASEYRKTNPKSALNRETLARVDVSGLV